MEKFIQWMHRYVSPVYIALLIASFILWYIAKLDYTYTTEQVMKIQVGKEQFPVTCVVEGNGTNLFGYRVYGDRTLRIPLSELRVGCSTEAESIGKLIIDPQSLRNAISVRCTDIKIISVGEIPPINDPQQ